MDYCNLFTNYLNYLQIFINHFEANMLTTLRLQRNILASEASLVTNLADYFGKKFPSIIENFRSTTDSLMSSFSSLGPNTQFNAQVSSKHKDFIKLMQRTNFMNINEVTIYTPEGLCVSYNTYLDTLVQMVSFCETIDSEMTEFNVFLSRLISDDNYQLSTDYVKSKLYNITKDIDTIIDAGFECFKKGSTQSETKVKNLLRNNSEWHSVLGTLNDLIKRLDAIDKDKVQKKLKESNELLAVFLPKIKKGEFQNISPQMVEKLGDYTYLIAKSLEVYSVTNYRVMTIEAAINKSIEKLTLIANK